MRGWWERQGKRHKREDEEEEEGQRKGFEQQTQRDGRRKTKYNRGRSKQMRRPVISMVVRF